MGSLPETHRIIIFQEHCPPTPPLSHYVQVLVPALPHELLVQTLVTKVPIVARWVPKMLLTPANLKCDLGNRPTPSPHRKTEGRRGGGSVHGLLKCERTSKC